MFKGKELTKNLVKRESIDSLTRWPEKTKISLQKKNLNKLIKSKFQIGSKSFKMNKNWLITQNLINIIYFQIQMI